MSATPKSNATSFKDDLHRVGQDVGTIKTEIGSLGHDAADAARSGAAELRQGAHHAVGVAKDTISDARHAAGDGMTSIRDTIAKHPLASIGVAAGAGMVMAMLMLRFKR